MLICRGLLQKHGLLDYSLNVLRPGIALPLSRKCSVEIGADENLDIKRVLIRVTKHEVFEDGLADLCLAKVNRVGCA